MSQVTLNVEGMSCQHCVKAVESNVGEMSGVDSVKVHLDQGTVDVNYQESSVTVDQIKDVIEDQGYDVK
ncbi:copper chaperone CopZ [Jeotgalibacillus haloalkalitolerans]|uniref:Copper chaperone CopZ n=1 Tax=Jeotgalibacillus haloalkalitolerans TaxID=3104292 RepID=A0ABU5KPK1_9BACL|nr:copper chaperone CopZ [Jeotgalibacillus sp. HH7-29]MDZ5713179.1 copper chaperone CopZ [Jeotgalibacillus sp. HH7-29]